jgi:hypothetical protein
LNETHKVEPIGISVSFISGILALFIFRPGNSKKPELAVYPYRKQLERSSAVGVSRIISSPHASRLHTGAGREIAMGIEAWSPFRFTDYTSTEGVATRIELQIALSVISVR